MKSPDHGILVFLCARSRKGVKYAVVTCQDIVFSTIDAVHIKWLITQTIDSGVPDMKGKGPKFLSAFLSLLCSTSAMKVRLVGPLVFVVLK